MEDQGIIDDLSLGAINNEYDSQILKLKERLTKAKEERKKTENEYNIIKHRLTILKNQEITNNINYQNIKYRFKMIIKNRLQSGNYNKNKNKKMKNLTPLINYGFSTTKKSKNNASKKDKKRIHRNKTHNNFYSGLNQNIMDDNLNNKNENYNINDSKNKNEISEEETEKNIIKKKLIEKLKEDQEEKKRIEEEIAKIEEEELLLINEFNNSKYKK